MGSFVNHDDQRLGLPGNDHDDHRRCQQGGNRQVTPMGKDGTKKNGLMGCGHAAMQIPALGGSWFWQDVHIFHEKNESFWGSKFSHQPQILFVTRPLETRHLQAPTDDCDWKEFAPLPGTKSAQKWVHRDMLSCSKLGSGRRYSPFTCWCMKI